MKRLAWLLLAFFCTAAVQVAPAEAMAAKAKPCACCHPGVGAMPGCCPAPAAAPVALAVEPGVHGVRLLVRAARPLDRAARDFRFACVAPPLRRAASVRAFPDPRGTRVPLFKAQRRLLI